MWKIWFTVFGLFVLGQILVTKLYSLPVGPQLAGDSGRYLSGGETFPHLDQVQWGYSGYCALMWVDNLVGFNNWPIVILQAAAVVLAARLLWDLAKSQGGHFAGVVAATLFLVNPLIAQWTRYILAEALFYVATVVLLWGATKWLGPERNVTPALIFGAIGSVTTRPNGVVVIPVLLAVGVLLAGPRTRRRLLGSGVVVLAAGLAVASLPTFQSGGGGAENSFVQRMARGEVLWNEDQWSIDMPQVSSTASTNFDLVVYVAAHPFDVAVLGSARLGAELIQVRPQYSALNNLMAGLIMVSFLAFFASGFSFLKRSHLRLSVILISLPYMGLISLTWAIQEGRFGWWFMVTWIPIAAVGVDRMTFRLGRPNGLDWSASDTPTR